MGRHYDVIMIFQNTIILRRPRVANSADIIINTAVFIKATFKNSKKVTRIINYVIKYNLYLRLLL